MLIVIEFLPLILLIFPGILVLLFLNRTTLNTLPRWVQINTIFLISFGFNGWIFTIIRDIGALTRWNVFTYLTLAWLLTSFITVLAARRKKFQLTRRRLWQGHYGQHLLPLCMIGAFGIVSAYYAYLWPPTWWDNLFYHLPIAKTSVNGSFRWYLASKGSRFAWVLASYPQSFEIMIALFFMAKSSLYKLVPVSFGVSVVATTYSLSKVLFKSKGQALLALLFAITSPALLLHSTQFYVDLPLTAFATASVMLIVLYMQTRNSETLWLASVLAGFGALVKLSGLHLAILMVVLYGILVFLQQRNSQLFEHAFKKEKSFFRSRSTLMCQACSRLLPIILFITVVSYWYIKRALFVNVPPYPAQPDAPLRWSEIWQALQQGVNSWLFGHDSRTGFPLPVLLGYGLSLIWFLRIGRVRKAFCSITWWFLHGLVIAWIVAIPLGIILFVRRLEWFLWVGRYLLPIYPVMVVLAAHAWTEIILVRFRTFIWQFTSQFSRLFIVGIGGALVAFVLLMGPTRLKEAIIRVDKYIPLYSTTKIIFNRVGDWNTPLRLSEQQKMRVAYGDELYDMWTFVNQFTDSGDKILSEDTRCYYIEALCYDAAGLPHKASAIQLSKWFATQQIRLLIDSKSLHDFEIQNPNVYEFLKLRGQRVWENNGYVVYQILYGK